jgi:hypothetical protein
LPVVAHVGTEAPMAACTFLPDSGCGPGRAAARGARAPTSIVTRPARCSSGTRRAWASCRLPSRPAARRAVGPCIAKIGLCVFGSTPSSRFCGTASAPSGRRGCACSRSPGYPVQPMKRPRRPRRM